MIAQETLVIVVEDDFVDAERVRRQVTETKLDCELVIHNDGQSALDFLRDQKSAAYENERMLIILDINMPGMNGHEFLREVRNDLTLKHTIVFILTTSAHPRDLEQAFENHVSGYFTKANMSGLIEVVTAFVKRSEFPPRLSE